MKAAVLTDGTFPLPKAITDRPDVYSFQLLLNFEDSTATAEMDDPAAIHAVYDRIEASPTLPTTAQMHLDTLYTIYDDLVVHGFDTLFVMVIPVGISSTVNTLQGVANEYADKIKTHIVGRRIIANGLSKMVKVALDDIDAGKSEDEIVRRMAWYDKNIPEYTTVGSFDQLVKGGRASRFVGTIGNLLKIVPIVSPGEEGNLMLTAKTRTNQRAMAKVKQTIVEDAKHFPKGGEVLFVHADDPENAERLAEEIKRELPDNYTVGTEYLTPIIGVHIGRGSMAATVLPDPANIPE